MSSRVVLSAALVVAGLVVACESAERGSVERGAEAAVQGVVDAAADFHEELENVVQVAGRELEALSLHVQEAGRSGREEVEAGLEAALEAAMRERARLDTMLAGLDPDEALDPDVRDEVSRLDARVTGLLLQARVGREAFTTRARMSLADMESEMRGMADRVDATERPEYERLGRSLETVRSEVVTAGASGDSAFVLARPDLVERLTALRGQVRRLGLDVQANGI